MQSYRLQVSSSESEFAFQKDSQVTCRYRLEMGVSGNLWIVVKDVKTLVVYDVE